jgi:hypothetical protein
MRTTATNKVVFEKSFGGNQSKSRQSRLTIYYDKEMKNKQVIEPDMTRFDGNWGALVHGIALNSSFYKYIVS